MKKETALLFALSLSCISAGELTLDQAKKQALETGWKIRENQTDNTAREWQKKNVVAGYMPNVNYGATLLRMDQETVDKANMSFAQIEAMKANPATAEMYAGIDVNKLKTRDNTLSHELSVSQPITNGGAEFVAIKMAKHTRAAQEKGYQADRQDLMLNVTKSYFDLLKAAEQKKILEADFAWAKKNFETAQIRFSGGLISRPDLIRWQQQVTEKEYALGQMEALVKISRAALVQNMGQDPASAEAFDPESFEVFEKRFASLTDLAEGSITKNARVQSLENYTLLADDGRKMALAAAMPKVNGFFKLSKDQGWDSGDQLYSKDRTIAGGVSVAVPIFSGFRSSTGYMEKKYDAMKSSITLEETKAGLTVNLIRIREMYEASRKSVAGAKELVAVVEESQAMMTTRYNAGQLTQLDLLDMNRAVVGARISYISKVLETLALYEEYQIAVGNSEVSK